MSERFELSEYSTVYRYSVIDNIQKGTLKANEIIILLSKQAKKIDEQQATISQLREMNGQLREINKELGDDLYNCRLNKNIIREKLKLWQDVHKEYNIYNINDFEELMKSIKR